MPSFDGRFPPTLPPIPGGFPQQQHQAPVGPPPELEQYAAFDFKPGGQIFNDFMQEVDVAVTQARANGQTVLRLSTASEPDYLTSAMSIWFGRVQAVRQQAVAAVKSAFENDRLEGGAQGRFIQAELDKTEFEYRQKKRKLIHDHQEKRRSDYERLHKLTEREQIASHAYRDMRADLGDREPTITRWWLYLAGLLGVGVAEALLNYESFAAIKWASPAIALGMTILVATALAFASHCHGTLLKQWEYYFGADKPDISRWRAWQLLGLGSTAFSVALGAVYYARDLYLTDIALLRSSTGSLSDDNPLWIIGGSLIGNVIVYIVGFLIAYFMHDSNPEYPKKLLELRGIEQTRKQLLDKLNREQHRPLEQLSEEHKKSVERLRNVEAQQRRAPGYARNQALFAMLEQQDKYVEAALRQFRSRFIGALSAAPAGMLPNTTSHTFVMETELGEGKYITAGEFDSLPIKVRYGSA